MSLSVTLGTKRKLEGAISVEMGEAILIPHPECNGLVCRGSVPVDSGFSERLKQSQTITIEATDTTHQGIGLSLSLADFAQAYDGPASEPKVSEMVVSKEKFKEDMVPREEERKARECKE